MIDDAPTSAAVSTNTGVHLVALPTTAINLIPVSSGLCDACECVNY